MNHVDDEIQPPSRRTWRWYLGWATALLPIGAVAAYFIWLRVEGNALDAEIIALRKAGQPTKFEDLRTPAIPDSENAALLLREAAGMIDYNGAAWTAYNRLSMQWPMTDEERRITRQVVAANQAPLRHVDQSRTRPKFDWQLQFPVSDWRAVGSDLNQQRSLALLLAAAARDAHDRGDEPQAIAYLRDVRRIAYGVGEQPTLVSSLISIGLEALADIQLCDMLPDLAIAGSEYAAGKPLSPQAAADLIAELLDDRPAAARLRRAFLGDMVQIIDSLKAVDERGLAALRGANQPAPTLVETSTHVLTRPWYRREARLVLKQTNDFQTIGNASANLREYQTAADRRAKQVWGTRLKHPLIGSYHQSTDRGIGQHFQSVTRRRLAAAALAIRWFAVENDGRLPASLDDLVPKYLPKVPLDAMSDGKPIGYATDKGRPRIYSVGENGVDDSGSDDVAPVTGSKFRSEKREKDIVIDLTRRHRKPTEAEQGAGSGGGR